MTEQTDPLLLMESLRSSFREQLPQKLDELEMLIGLVQNREDARPKLRLVLHNLIGACGTFGYPQITELAKKLQESLTASPPTDLDQTRLLVQVMREAAGMAPAPMGESGEADFDALTQQKPPVEKVIYYAVSNQEVDRELMAQLAQFRMRTVRCEDLGELRSLVEHEQGESVMMLFLGQETIDEKMLASMLPSAERRNNVAVILVSGQRDLATRLAAGKAGIDVFLRAPTSLLDVLDALERLRAQTSGENIRVLIIDDELHVARYHEAVLTQAGMRVRTAHNIEQLDHVLQYFVPELILLDMYLPKWSGPEVARALRQQTELLDVPIVFLSSDSNRASKLDAYQSGGDDFLIKPIKPDFLVESVRVRAQRYRELRRVMLNDGLTQVFNRRSILQMLDREISRAQRAKTALSLALIDVDHFKKINDSHGHMAGDFVLKTLTRLLKQRLRRSDLIGRYGGEEFIVVLPEANVAQAVKLLDEIRATFAELEQHADQPFRVTFSAGIAAFDVEESKQQLLERADDALYRAKDRGRNQISE